MKKFTIIIASSILVAGFFTLALHPLMGQRAGYDTKKIIRKAYGQKTYWIYKRGKGSCMNTCNKVGKIPQIVGHYKKMKGWYIIPCLTFNFKKLGNRPGFNLTKGDHGKYCTVAAGKKSYRVKYFACLCI